ncbi:MAG: hypothetical protein OEX08_03050 [Candidatus Nomurabacteria bacterium]|nr:hypothetical protein [Candidatus Nomurabacteria bacterium]
MKKILILILAMFMVGFGYAQGVDKLTRREKKNGDFAGEIRDENGHVVILIIHNKTRKNPDDKKKETVSVATIKLMDDLAYSYKNPDNGDVTIKYKPLKKTTIEYTFINMEILSIEVVVGDGLDYFRVSTFTHKYYIVDGENIYTHVDHDGQERWYMGVRYKDYKFFVKKLDTVFKIFNALDKKP